MGALSGHPNIVAVVDVGIPVEGTPYLIMPYLARGSLADTMATSGPQPWPEVVRIGVKTGGCPRVGPSARHPPPRCEAGQHLGVGLRRAPARRLRARTGLGRLRDDEPSHHGVGGARRPRDPRRHGAERARPTCTRSPRRCTPSSPGTPHSPPRDDESLVALYVRIASSPVPELDGHGAPESLNRVLAAAMSKRPDERPTSAAEFGRMLQDLEAAEGVPVTDLPIRDAGSGGVSLPRASSVVSGPTRVTSTAPGRRPWIWVAVAVAAVAVVGATIWALNDSPSGRLLAEAAHRTRAMADPTTVGRPGRPRHR